MKKLNSEDIGFSAPEAILTLQEQLLRKHLLYLQQKSPFYSQLFRQCNFNSEQFSSMSALQELPFTSKKDLEKHNAEFLAVEERAIADICQTSGTTGEPVTIWQTETDLLRLTRNEVLAFSNAGVTGSDRVLIGTTLDRVFMAGMAYFLGLRSLGATVIRAGSGLPVLVADLISRHRPNVLVGVPSLLLEVGQQLEKRGLSPAIMGVDKIICIGEPVRKNDLGLSVLGEKLKDQWRSQVLGTYAGTELATAFTDCTEGCGGHLLPELVVVEIVDQSGRLVTDGEAGEVVVTPLGVEGTPLLRYRTGDIARLHLDPCDCGRKTPRMGPIIGRLAQMLKVRGTTMFPAAVGQVLEEIDGVKGHYLEVFSEFDLSDRLRVVVGCHDVSLNASYIAEQIAARTRVRPEVLIVSPEDVHSKTIRSDHRKPITFFDYRQCNLERKAEYE